MLFVKNEGGEKWLVSDGINRCKMYYGHIMVLPKVIILYAIPAACR